MPLFIAVLMSLTGSLSIASATHKFADKFTKGNESTARHEIRVELFPQAVHGYLHIQDKIFSSLAISQLLIPKPATEITLSYKGVALPFQTETPSRPNGLWQKILPQYPEGTPLIGELLISYNFEPLPQDPHQGGTSKDKVSNEIDAAILDEGVYLSPSSFWYPHLEAAFEQFEMLVSVPLGWSSMTSGVLLASYDSGTRHIEKWQVNYPSEPIHLIANQFIIGEEVYRGVRLQTYFHSEVASHSTEYLVKLKKYLDIYLNFFGSYPYEKFAVVSNFFSTGYGMASYTLLDKNIIPFPFIVDISLGHELLHNYWGNSVYVDSRGGNWCEGLTVFQADYLYELLKGPKNAMNYRRDVVRKYANFVDNQNAIAVRDFQGRYNSATQAIGYGKVMMIFAMLEQELGVEIMNKGLSQMAQQGKFKYQSWADFQSLFESLAQRDLTFFFDQWINRKDVPELSLLSSIKGSQITLGVGQTNSKPYTLSVPVRIDFASGKNHWVRIPVSGVYNEEHFDFSTQEPNDPIVKAELDPEFQLMRAPFPLENPPTLSKFWGRRGNQYGSSYPVTKELDDRLSVISSSFDNHEDEKKVVFFDSNQLNYEIDSAAFIFAPLSDLKNVFFQRLLREQDRIKLEGTLLTLKESGKQFDLAKNLVAAISFEVRGRPVVLFIAPDQGDHFDKAERLSHYSKFSYVILNEQGRRVDAGIWGE